LVHGHVQNLKYQRCLEHNSKIWWTMLAALLMTVDCGTAESLSKAAIQIAVTARFLEANQRHDLVVVASKSLETLRTAASKRQLNAQAKRVIVGQIERLTQTFYDAANAWRELDSKASGSNQPLQLSETAEPPLMAEYIANTRRHLDQPKVAIELGGVDEVPALGKIAARVLELVRNGSAKGAKAMAQ
jgi:hypothetical protein